MSERRLAVLDGDPAAEQAHRALRDGGVVEPVGHGGPEQLLWTSCDLAAFAENRLGEDVDPRALDASHRADITARATTEPLWPLSVRERLERCYWLLTSGRRVGTVALARSGLGGSLLSLSSLYVFPTERGRGVGQLALQRIRDALGAQGRGLRLGTCWSWQRTLRFYLARGMWARTWKRDVELVWQADLPPPVLTVGERDASLAVRLDGRLVPLVVAERDGDRLRAFGRSPGHPERAPRLDALRPDAETTLALSLALHGWPLLTSPEKWPAAWRPDAGRPEGLAHRIVMWEAWARHHGWQVATPRIPGLTYRTWAEIAESDGAQPRSGEEPQ
ncbi:MAG: GNAT family N-acetyltransferase [Polyangiaceae bacterium]